MTYPDFMSMSRSIGDYNETSNRNKGQFSQMWWLMPKKKKIPAFQRLRQENYECEISLG